MHEMTELLCGDFDYCTSSTREALEGLLKKKGGLLVHLA